MNTYVLPPLEETHSQVTPVLPEDHAFTTGWGITGHTKEIHGLGLMASIRALWWADVHHQYLKF